MSPTKGPAPKCKRQTKMKNTTQNGNFGANTRRRKENNPTAKL
jgi:hypothetical protein